MRLEASRQINPRGQRPNPAQPDPMESLMGVLELLQSVMGQGQGQGQGPARGPMGR